MTNPVRYSILPLTFVHATVLPALLAEAVLHFFPVDNFQLSCVSYTVAKVFIDDMDDLFVIDWLEIHHRREVYLDWVI